MELVLLRHAKAAGKSEGLPDFARPLTHDGERQAEAIGRRLLADGLRFDVVVSSPAARALGTARRACTVLGIDAARIRAEPRLYEASASDVADVAAQASEGAQRVLLVGHNPGFERYSIQLGALDEGWALRKGCATRFLVADARSLRAPGGGRLVDVLEP